MTKKTSKSLSGENVSGVVGTINNATQAGKNIWSIIITVGVFVATIWTTQQVVNTRLSFLEGEISSLKAKDSEISKQVSDSSDAHKILLVEISSRLREMELRFTELKTRVELVLEKDGLNRSSVEKPN
jgi:hypothetical protein